MPRRPALDGLRGLAVLAVMAFHTSPAAHGGFMGVDIFFVISGYLITTLLLAEHARTGGVDLYAFYLRRLLRLGPALLFMLVIAVPLILILVPGTMGMPMVAAVTSVLLYVANWANVWSSASTGPLTHTWSLSIEEQFYLVWPLLLVALLARRHRPPAKNLAALIILVAVARCLAWNLTHGKWIYYATTSHSDGLLIGALLAVLLARQAANSPAPLPAPAAAPSPFDGEPSFTALIRPDGTAPPAAVRPNTTVAAWAGMAGIAALMATLSITSNATFQYGLLLIALCTALVLWHLATETDGLLIRLLSLRPLTLIGTVSYGLYLYHFPIFQVVQHRGYSHLLQHFLEITLTAAVTAFSWFVVEQPALRLKDRIGKRPTRALARR